MTNCSKQALNVLLILAISAAAIAFGLSLFVFFTTNAMNSAQNYFRTHEDVIAWPPYRQHSFQGSTPLELHMPNDLSDFVGREVSFECVSAGGHSVVIRTGRFPTFWQLPNARRAVCTGGAGSGLTVRVTSPSTLRIVSNQGFTFL
mgnify:FL=1